jgi:hypothetical protein
VHLSLAALHFKAPHKEEQGQGDLHQEKFYFEKK